MQKQLLSLVKRELEKRSMIQLATALGYRSQNTIGMWIRNGKIPAIAVGKLTKYFKKEIKR